MFDDYLRPALETVIFSFDFGKNAGATAYFTYFLRVGHLIIIKIFYLIRVSRRIPG